MRLLSDQHDAPVGVDGPDSLDRSVGGHSPADDQKAIRSHLGPPLLACFLNTVR
jgi:hypothetical protein